MSPRTNSHASLNVADPASEAADKKAAEERYKKLHAAGELMKTM